MFRCKHVFFRIFPQFSQYLYLTDSHRVHPTLAEYTHLHAHSQARADTHAHMHKRTHTHTHRINVKKKKQSSVEWCSSSAQFVVFFFSSGDVEDVCDSTESHTSPLRPSSVQHDLWLLAKSPVSHQSQGQPWAHVPCFYRDGLKPFLTVRRWRLSNPNKTQLKASSWPLKLWNKQDLTKWLVIYHLFMHEWLVLVTRL